MPHGIEYIVRPFQSPGSLGNIVIPATPKETVEQAHIIWGGKGTMPAVKLINPSTVVNVCHETATEKSRDTDQIRIEQPGKPENYVDVDRVRNMRLDKTETNVNPSNLSTKLSTPPRLAVEIANDPGFHATTDDTNPDKRCGLVWSFKNEI